VNLGKLLKGVKERKLFLRWALINGLFIFGMVAARVAYHGHIHTVGQFAIGALFVLYLLTAAYCGAMAWKESLFQHGYVQLAIELSPMIAMLGTTAGFLIAFSSGASDVQHRVLGASTSLASTFVGIACAAILMVNRHLLVSSLDEDS
jgi:hypothetical protein